MKSFPANQDNALGLSNELLNEFGELLDQSMIKIHHCLEQLDADQVWWCPRQGLNSIGNLMLHLAGNLRQWAICGISETPSHRDRESEFVPEQHVPREELVRLLETTVDAAKQSIRNLSAESLLRVCSIQEFQVTKLRAIIHTTNHFVGHTHQIVLLTRLMLGDAYRFHWSPEGSRKNVPI